MMADQVLQPFDVDVEEGEVSDSSDEVYVPLTRPNTLPTTATSSSSPTVSASKATPGAAISDRMDQTADDLEEEVTQSDSSSGDSSSDNCLTKLSPKSVADSGERKKRKLVQRTVMLRAPPASAQDETAQKRSARFKKYNVWTEALQEDALTETMRGCDVTRPSMNDRSVENYDFTILQRMSNKNSLKRRLSNSGDEVSDSEMPHVSKRGRRISHGSGRNRYGSRSKNRRRGSSSASSENCNEPRHILDLNDVGGRDPMDVAREIANKLYEEKDELLVRIVEVLGVDVPVAIYKETQRIEADGGMMIQTGERRRTPGGVFLFLLKHDNNITADQLKSIFTEDRQQGHRLRRQIKAISRDRKVEELKKRLSETGKELPALNTRKEHFLLGTDLSVEHPAGNLSNPPPSPVGQDQSPDYKTHAINVTGDEAKISAASTSTNVDSKELISYDDDFLDVNCGDMDVF